MKKMKKMMGIAVLALIFSLTACPSPTDGTKGSGEGGGATEIR